MSTRTIFPVNIVGGTCSYSKKRYIEGVLRFCQEKGLTVLKIINSKGSEVRLALNPSPLFGKPPSFLIVEDPSLSDYESLALHSKKKSPATAVIIIIKGTIPSKGPLARLAKKLPEGSVSVYDAPKPWEARKVLMEEAKKLLEGQNIAVEPEALDLVVSSSGHDLGMLYFEISKLFMLASHRGSAEITVQMAQDTVAYVRTEGVLALIDAVRVRNATGLSSSLSDMRRSYNRNRNHHVVRVANRLIGSMVKWLHVSSLREEDMGVSAISKETGIHEFVIKKDILAATRKWSTKELLRAIAALSLIVRKTKDGARHPWAALECALFEAVGSSSFQ